MDNLCQTGSNSQKLLDSQKSKLKRLSLLKNTEFKENCMNSDIETDFKWCNAYPSKTPHDDQQLSSPNPDWTMLRDFL